MKALKLPSQFPKTVLSRLKHFWWIASQNPHYAFLIKQKIVDMKTRKQIFHLSCKTISFRYCGFEYKFWYYLSSFLRNERIIWWVLFGIFLGFRWGKVVQFSSQNIKEPLPAPPQKNRKIRNPSNLKQKSSKTKEISLNIPIYNKAKIDSIEKIAI